MDGDNLRDPTYYQDDKDQYWREKKMMNQEEKNKILEV